MFPVTTCPENSHYELCGTDCGHTCASSIDVSCEHTCSEGCFCDVGLVRSGGLCVPVDQCGCLYDGFYLNVRIETLFWLIFIRSQRPVCSISLLKQLLTHTIVLSSGNVDFIVLWYDFIGWWAILEYRMFPTLWVFCSKWSALLCYLLPTYSGVYYQRWTPWLLRSVHDYDVFFLYEHFRIMSAKWLR